MLATGEEVQKMVNLLDKLDTSLKIAEILKDHPSWFRDCQSLEVFNMFPAANRGRIELIYMQMYAPTTLAPLRDLGTLRYTTSLEDGSLVRSAKMTEPSKVIHVRNVGHEISESDLLQLVHPFGVVTKLVMLRAKDQPLLQMQDMASAVNATGFRYDHGSSSLNCLLQS